MLNFVMMPNEISSAVIPSLELTHLCVNSRLGITALESATVILTLPPVTCSKVAVGYRVL